ncbi:MAG: hypothetical protein L6R41_001722 [Letrouitia leprolyta]|nr:MAG: hypothetical protein L6R41_001722 [Letrouitia leprolyta]
MAVRGQRFQVDLGDDSTTSQQNQSINSTTRGPWSLVADIQEHVPSSATRYPSPPNIKSSSTGFPTHKKRSKPSVFKQRTSQADGKDGSNSISNVQAVSPSVTNREKKTTELPERHEIDRENKKRITEMSEEEIEQAKIELMSGLSESFIERLLKKANIEQDQEIGYPREGDPEKKISSSKRVTFEDDTSIANISQLQIQDDASGPNPESASIEPPPDLQPVSTFSGYPAPPSIHFLRPPTPPTLDLEDPEFLSKLHSTYFPSLPSNPNALSWMQPPDPAENEAYSPSRDNLPPSAVRFDFKGRLLPPRLASQIPTTKGLHHHGTAPEAAGYTIPELAHLSRSSFPSQRCIAYQTLGRILYRLGMGVFGPEDHELCQGLWKCIEQGRVLDTLTAEAARDGESGNRSCWVTAIEAVWLWRKGGGRKWKAT